MYSDKDTDRMQSGLAFSDILGFGFGFKSRDFFIDIRYSIRHV